MNMPDVNKKKKVRVFASAALSEEWKEGCKEVLTIRQKIEDEHGVTVAACEFHIADKQLVREELYVDGRISLALTYGESGKSTKRECYQNGVLREVDSFQKTSHQVAEVKLYDPQGKLERTVSSGRDIEPMGRSHGIKKKLPKLVVATQLAAWKEGCKEILTIRQAIETKHGQTVAVCEFNMADKKLVREESFMNGRISFAQTFNGKGKRTKYEYYQNGVLRAVDHLRKTNNRIVETELYTAQGVWERIVRERTAIEHIEYEYRNRYPPRVFTPLGPGR